MKILMLHGINHNMFGKRDPEQYGTITLAEIDAKLQALGKELGAEVESFQTNSEGAMCERIHQAYAEGMDAGADQRRRLDPLQLRHPRRAGDPDLPDRRAAHVEHSRARGVPPSVSVFAEIVKGQICGFGVDSYLLAPCAPRCRQHRAGNELRVCTDDQRHHRAHRAHRLPDARLQGADDLQPLLRAGGHRRGRRADGLPGRRTIRRSCARSSRWPTSAAR